ncbi:hypothetical protein H6785_01360 [Candidatus Nomurabacteria bacterium]|nr:hypothetical protein [Candidatus Kaiserbacteria bacterium]MCB9815218.1 hypothetical protein [Candidatus Nomurabacteria bacterium]
MENSESPKTIDKSTIRRMSNKLAEVDYIWYTNFAQNLKGLVEMTPQTALAIITETVEGAARTGLSINDMGNISSVIVEISKLVDPESATGKAEEYFGIKGQPTPEEIIIVLENIARFTGGLNQELENAYVTCLEISVHPKIVSCEQDPDCIETALQEIREKITLVNIDQEKIKGLQNNINSWAYLPKPAETT